MILNFVEDGRSRTFTSKFYKITQKSVKSKGHYSWKSKYKTVTKESKGFHFLLMIKN